jgi:alcohol dehydrogenase class IV
VFLITDAKLLSLPVIDSLIQDLSSQALEVTLFSDVQPDPTIEQCERALAAYRDAKCTAIIALGGGSVMDTAKAVAARLANPKKSIAQMAGVLKVRGQVPPLVCIPTTAGTGSETTVTAVITDEQDHTKFAVNDPKLVPTVAVLDAELMLGLPPALTAATGMDALTHAVECYINKFASPYVKTQARAAVVAIHQHLLTCYEQGDNVTARQAMAQASFDAGTAFTRNYVGYVHALAHQIGGLYHVPHGQANATLLPFVLRAFGKAAEPALATLAGDIGVSSGSEAERAAAFIAWIEQMNTTMAIPGSFDALEAKDYQHIVQFAKKEAEPQYPVPRLLSAPELIWILKQVTATAE